MSNIKLVGGLDIGNGYVKGKIRDANNKVSLLDLPSAVAIDTAPAAIPVSDNDRGIRCSFS